MIQNKRETLDKGKEIMWSTSVIFEERPDVPSPKRKRIEKEQAP